MVYVKLKIICEKFLKQRVNWLIINCWMVAKIELDWMCNVFKNFLKINYYYLWMEIFLLNNCHNWNVLIETNHKDTDWLGKIGKHWSVDFDIWEMWNE